MKTLRLNLDRTLGDNAITDRYTVPSPTPAGKVPLLTLKHGVYHADDITVTNVATGQPLLRGVDYVEAAYSRHLKLNYDIDGFGGVAILNPAISGELDVTVKYVGGGYSVFGTEKTPDFLTLAGDDLPQHFWDDLVECSFATDQELNLTAILNEETRLQALVSALGPLEELNRGLTTTATRKAIEDIVRDAHVRNGNMLSGDYLTDFTQYNAQKMDIFSDRLVFTPDDAPWTTGAIFEFDWEADAWYVLSFDVEMRGGDLNLNAYHDGSKDQYILRELVSSGRFNMVWRPSDGENGWGADDRLVFHDPDGDADCTITNISVRKMGNHIEDILEQRCGKLDTTARTVAEAINEVLASADQLEGGVAFAGYINGPTNLNTFNENYDAGWVVGADSAVVSASFDDDTLQKTVTFGQAVLFDRVTKKFRVVTDCRQASVMKLDWYENGMPTGHKIVHELIDSLQATLKLPPVAQAMKQSVWAAGAAYARVDSESYGFYTVVSEDNITIRLYKGDNSYTSISGLLGDVIVYDPVSDTYTTHRTFKLGGHRRGSIIEDINALIGGGGSGGLSAGTVLYSYKNHNTSALIPFGSPPQSRTKYKELFGFVGSTFGAGDGENTFGIPGTGQHLFGGAVVGDTTIGSVDLGLPNVATKPYTDSARSMYPTPMTIEAERLVFESGITKYRGAMFNYNFDVYTTYVAEFDLVLNQGELMLAVWASGTHDGQVGSNITSGGHHKIEFTPADLDTDGMGNDLGFAFIDPQTNADMIITNITISEKVVSVRDAGFAMVDPADADRLVMAVGGTIHEKKAADAQTKPLTTLGQPKNAAPDSIGNGILYLRGDLGGWHLVADPLDGSGPVLVDSQDAGEGPPELKYIYHYEGDEFLLVGGSKVVLYNRSTEESTELVPSHGFFGVTGGISIPKNGKFYLSGFGPGYSLMEVDVAGKTTKTMDVFDRMEFYLSSNASGELTAVAGDPRSNSFYVYDFSLGSFNKLADREGMPGPLIYSPDHGYYYELIGVDIVRWQFGFEPNGYVVAGTVTE